MLVIGRRSILFYSATQKLSRNKTDHAAATNVHRSKKCQMKRAPKMYCYATVYVLNIFPPWVLLPVKHKWTSDPFLPCIHYQTCSQRCHSNAINLTEWSRSSRRIERKPGGPDARGATSVARWASTPGPKSAPISPWWTTRPSERTSTPLRSKHVVRRTFWSRSYKQIFSLLITCPRPIS